jgi:uncharacterized sulfatase
MKAFPKRLGHFLFALFFFPLGTLAAALPNILFILVDDLGWSELGCYGDDFFETPNVDQLAAEGMRFTDAYAPAPICSASRASFLTGRTPARTGLEFVVKRKQDKPALANTRLLQPPFTLDMPLEEVTIAEILKDAGYRTGIFGKWHLNEHYKAYQGWSPTHGPRQQGFQDAKEGFGAHPYSYQDRKFGSYDKGEYPQDAVTENSIEFLKENRNHPFFLFYSSFYPHEPVHTRCQWLYDKYAAKPEAKGTAGDRAMYGAFVEQMDHYIGQLLTAIDDLGLRENTLVVFSSDNGNSPMYQYRNILRGGKWDLYEGGIRVPLIARWPSRIQAGSKSSIPVHGVDLLPTFLEIATVSISKDRPIDGSSLVKLFSNPNSSKWQDRELYWHFPYYHPRITLSRPQSAIRRGPWKLIYFYEDHSVQLFNVERDIGERNDLSTARPEIASDLQSSLQTYLQTSYARMPKPHPDYDSANGGPIQR